MGRISNYCLIFPTRYLAKMTKHHIVVTTAFLTPELQDRYYQNRAIVAIVPLGTVDVASHNLAVRIR